MYFKRRTHTCGELRTAQAGETVVLNGWVDRRRDLGNIIFIWLRDRYGITQLVFSQQSGPEAYLQAKDLRSEYVVSVTGIVKERSEENKNPDLQTGEIEIWVNELTILNEAETTPFLIKDNIDAFEDLRLKYRYLDLRRPVMQRNLLLRHKLYQLTRNYFSGEGFIEIETPMLMKSTPEGARDYLVPSRIHKGKFYALPQSPQTYKQLLMVSGFDKYFQIVKCFRDEDFRADRQPEFTQIDVEMSFVERDDVFNVVEGLMKIFYKEIWNTDLQLPLPKLTFDEALEKYGSDKPDLRFGLELKTLNEIFAGTGFKVFKESLARKGIITGICAPGCGNYSRSQLDNLTGFVKSLGAAGLIWFRVSDNDLEGSVSKFLSDQEKKDIREIFNASGGDLILILSGDREKTLTIMGELRIEMAERLKLITPDTKPQLLWVTDFPLLEWDEETQRFYARHHPFTSPLPEDEGLLDTDPGKVRARAYDLVLNGREIAGGSIRIHKTDLQKKMFSVLGIDEKEAEMKFGFLLNAFKYGVPPHGGVAFGFDRLSMIFAGEDSIRDVIAFPKTASAVSLMDGSPSEVSEDQLKELHIKITN